MPRGFFTDADLIRFWHENALADEIAQREGVSRSTLIVEWRRLKMARLLPEGERPRNKMLHRENSVAGDRKDYNTTVGHDPLLAALKKGRR